MTDLQLNVDLVLKLIKEPELMAQALDIEGAPMAVVAMLADEAERLREQIRAAREQEPIAIVEYSDYQTISALVGDEPKKIAVRALFDGALRIGENLYASPIPAPAPDVPEEWIERWYGSGEAKDIGVELCRGSHIYTKNTREHIAFLGDTDVAHELCTEIVFRHNQSLLQSATQPAEPDRFSTKDSGV